MCPPYPAWGENDDGMVRAGIELGTAGIRLVNSGDPFSRAKHRDRNGALGTKIPTSRNTGDPWGIQIFLEQATDHWPSELMLCSN